MKSRREKIAALLDSPVAGERAAAAAALGRMVEPKIGSPLWFEAVRAWHGEIEWAASRITSPVLTPDEIRTIRNLAKHRGTPWARGADALIPVLQKLRNAEQRRADDRLCIDQSNGIILPQIGGSDAKQEIERKA